MRYAWNRQRSVDPDAFGRTVEALSDMHGGVCPPSAIVDEARPSESVLHPMFEWDDLAAAESYRREQARHHLRELRIVVLDENGEEEEAQAFVHIVKHDDGVRREGYRLTTLVLQDESETEQMLDEAKSGLRSWRRRYKHLSELGNIFSLIDEVV